MNTLKYKLSVIILLLVCNYGLVNAQASKITISENEFKGAVPLVSSSNTTQILIDNSDAKVVEIAANLLADDIKMVTGQSVEVISSVEDIRSKSLIICGTIGKSKLVDELINSKKIDVSEIESNWEASIITTIKRPIKGVKKAVVIAGSDRRGTAYGVMDISKAIGVSPWVWWADALPAKKKALYLHEVTHIEKGPSVQYRGIFINDEDWSLTPWISKTFEPEVGNIGPKTYTKIFELMVRLKSNYLWPAMHGCSLPFNYFPETAKIADDFAIVMGASHCEPILRNNVTEWSKDGRDKSQWDYFKHPDLIQDYWDEILQSRGKYENLYTVGMRGIHDGSMPGSDVRSERVAMMEQIFEDQQDLIEKYADEKGEDVPMIFCPYKEVMYDYDAGMEVPEHITICWAEDNQGYVRRMPNEKEQKRSGGHGIYYHLSYWSDYLWQVSIAPELIANQLGRAYDFGMKKVWIANVGDIVAAERETQFFMDLGWDLNRWRDNKAHQWTKDWATETFGVEFGNDIAEMLNEYYRLAWRGKPEHIGHTVYNKLEAEQRLASYNRIAEKAETLRGKLPERLDVAYFRLVYYPIVAVAAQNDKILLARQSTLEKENGLINESEESFKQAEAAFEKVKALTEEYNALGGGKWNHIMNYQPRNLKVLKEPVLGSGLDFNNKRVRHATTLEQYNDLMIVPERIITLNDSLEILKGDNRTKIEIVDGLSIDGKGAFLLPNLAKSYENANDAPALQFKLNLAPGTYKARIKFLPSRPTDGETDMRCAFSANGESFEIKNVEEPKETFHNHHSCSWTTSLVSESSLDGYLAKDFNFSTDGETTLQIKILDTGMIFHRLEIFKSE